MFDEHFPPRCASTVERWTPTWSKQTDPSGRFVFLFSQIPLIKKETATNKLYRAITTHNAKYEGTE